MSVIPEPYQDLLTFRPLAIYFDQNAEELNRADRFWMMYDGGYEIGKSKTVGGLLGKMMNDFSGVGEGVFLDNLQDKEPSLSDLSIKNYDFEGESW